MSAGFTAGLVVRFAVAVVAVLSVHVFTYKGRDKPQATPQAARAQLLPLPAVVTKRLSMSHHSAFALFRSGHGTLEHLAALARVVYMSRPMLCAENPGATNAKTFRAAETVLHQCLIRMQGNENWQL
ncbi:hypothetical protein B0G69_5943 [Paraburkholderia sp. RAU2J]|uniref:hypothetical protein n=1 Tax=Paraburkholderia sp. RAU2J TaxID=1938810 RepID=UPI000EABBE8D|nr:hypothetical protein [Paraburkholderia sp. RAU2J]RKT22479.1 hypothetical protein B0G69_5943 [Paraburkholderia sp. RAU2J]